MSARIIFVGGPGRSGTSFVADRIGSHTDVATFKDVELKIFCEFGGMLDMQTVLVKQFSPNRGEMVFKQFRNMLRMVRTGGYGQPSLESIVPAERLDAVIEKFFGQLQPDGYITQLDFGVFNDAARDFVQELAQIALDQKVGTSSFLEKTPHICLHPKFLHELAPKARYIHTFRNPKAIAISLLNQAWGPAQLDHAIVWVQSYFESWFKAKAYFHRLGLPLLDLSIEKISENPSFAGEMVCEHLGLPANNSLFSGSDVNQLQHWKTNLSDDSRALLNAKLGPLCELLGYLSNEEDIGDQA